MIKAPEEMLAKGNKQFLGVSVKLDNFIGIMTIVALLIIMYMVGEY